jgi:hypothetical protein
MRKPGGNAFFLLVANKKLRLPFLKTVRSIYDNFFRLQRRLRRYERRRRGRDIAVNVDHPLDKAIPFSPRWAMIYHDFSAFWARAAVYLFRALPTGAGAVDFIETVDGLYVAAARVYSRRLSTTVRPVYFGNIGCIVIQAFDPHLFCVPSLHVMICIHTWIKARSVLERGGAAEREKAYISHLFEHAVLITESILYMKQHSVNCIAAAMYAVSCFEPDIFTRKEAGVFAAALFTNEPRNAEIPPAQRMAIRAYIQSRYDAFMDEWEDISAKDGTDWTAPLVAFLENRDKPSTS